MIETKQHKHKLDQDFNDINTLTNTQHQLYINILVTRSLMTNIFITSSYFEPCIPTSQNCVNNFASSI